MLALGPGRDGPGPSPGSDPPTLSLLGGISSHPEWRHGLKYW